MIAFGSSDMTKAYVGSTEVSKVYLGNELVWGGGSPALPYDAQVEYLQSSGVEGINTGILLDTSKEFKIEAGIVILSRSGSSKYIFSATNEALQVYTNNNRLFTQTAYGTPTVNTYTVMESTTLGKANTLKCFGWTKSANYGSMQGGESIWLLKNNEISSVGGALAQIYYCKIYIDSVLSRDYIPVRVGTVGYFYDNVSGNLFGNNGTGNFILGADV